MYYKILMRSPTLPLLKFLPTFIDVATLGRFKGVKNTLNPPYNEIKNPHFMSKRIISVST